MEERTPLLKVEHLKQYFPISKKFTVKAVDDVSFEIYPGETYGLVGESGSGKTTIGRSIIRLYDPTGGKIIFDGVDITGKMTKQENHMLRTEMQMIFQDPMACLNPRQKVADIIGQGLDINHMYSSKEERDEKIARILQKVGLAPEHAERYPHQFSGGQRQRVGIARALVMNPKLIIADECISALDASIQSQIINFLQELKEKENLTYMFISHDLSVVRYISDRICVMYLGNVVELASAEKVFSDPRHPYTVALLSSIPTTDVESLKKERILLEGNLGAVYDEKSPESFIKAVERLRKNPPERISLPSALRADFIYPEFAREVEEALSRKFGR